MKRLASSISQLHFNFNLHSAEVVTEFLILSIRSPIMCSIVTYSIN